MEGGLKSLGSAPALFSQLIYFKIHENLFESLKHIKNSLNVLLYREEGQSSRCLSCHWASHVFQLAPDIKSLFWTQVDQIFTALSALT